ncbi:MAG: T9SS type A sorting domain-containing protein [Chitinophagaceae bacterium]|nr:T9SS type A sorting domain-containing protein [Chitinophagaceae bacterium]
MKQKIFTLIIILFSFNVSKAQLAIGSTAPDFTYTDINNVTQNLYTYLDSGYTVIMDISATWCGPCWSVHNSHVFEDLTNQYGSNGTIDPKKIKIFFFEGDGSTTTADLNGTGSNTQGDWVTGTNYTIIDNAAIKNKYPIGGYPHFYVICSDKKVKYEIAGYMASMLSTPFWVNQLNDCKIQVGFETIEKSKIDVYPNPASNTLFVKGINGQLQIDLIDVLGRTVQQNSFSNIVNETSLDITNVTKGIYVLKISQGEKTITTQVVIDK